MPLKLSFLFAMTTNPTNLGQASPHSGGWSETIWAPSPYNAATFTALTNLATDRAAMLPVNASIIGYRVQQYTISVNRFLPGGTQSGGLLLPGNPAWPGDLPQASLMLTARTNAAANTRRFTFRGMPDQFIVNGEYQPSRAFSTALTEWIFNFGQFNWQFPGRDLSQANMRVISIAGGVVNVDNAAPVAAGDYLRFHRVRDENGNPVEGVYNIKSITGNAITLNGLATTIIAGESGTCRKDLAVMFNIADAVPVRAVVRKIGRPFAGYRGRR